MEVDVSILDTLFERASLETDLSPDDLEFRFRIDKHYERVYLRPLRTINKIVKQYDLFYYAHGRVEGIRFEDFRAFDGEITIKANNGEGYYIRAIRVDNYTTMYKIIIEIVNLMIEDLYLNDKIRKLNNYNINSMRDLINILVDEYTIENEYWNPETDETYSYKEELIIIEKIDSKDPFPYDYKITIDQAFKLIILITYSHICVIADLKEYGKAVKQILNKYVQWSYFPI